MILVIEDNEDFVFMLTEHQRWDTVIVTNAADAMSQLQTKPFTSVFCDVHGIDRNGLTAHDVVRYCAQIGTLCFITTNDPFTAEAFKRAHDVEHVDKTATYSALSTGGAA